MSTPTPPRVLGLDLSLTRTGYAAPDGNAGVLRSIHDSKHPEQRLRDITDRCTALAMGHHDGALDGPADLVSIEGFAFSRQSRALDQIHGLGWLVRMALRDLNLTYVVVTPTCLKRYAVGKGNADKQAMQMAAVKRLGYDDDAPDDNVVDALWLRALALDAYGHPVVKLPQAQRDAAVRALSWPRLRGVADA